jgi:hypothetical protein
MSSRAELPGWCARSIPGLPPIRRARDFHLYDRNGARYLDLFQNGGGAVLGHRQANVSLEMKKVMARGVYAELHSDYEERVRRAVARVLPEYDRVVVYASVFEAAHALSTLSELSAGGDGHTESVAGAGRDAVQLLGRVPDPALPAGSEGADDHPDAPDPRVRLWRPFLAEPPGGDRPEAVLPLLPFPMRSGPTVLCCGESVAARLPAPSPVSPVLLAGLARAADNLATLGSGAARHPETPRQKPGKKRRSKYGQSWQRFRHPLWRQNGPYIYPACDPIHYQRVFEHFLGNRVILNPKYPGPSILPRYWSVGEHERFRRLSDAARELL